MADAAEAWTGLLLLDKPAGPTSHDVIARVRRATGQRRVGHAGTLDPMASGLLPVVLGRATRLVRFLPHSPKTYRGTLRLGLRTRTDDVTGETIQGHEGPLPQAERVLAASAEFCGTFAQRPPDFSARRVGGQRMHRLARAGREVDAPPTTVRVDRFALAATGDEAVWSFEAIVSAGTYIRALARDLGEALGCGGTLASLVRTRIGPMELQGACAVPADEPADPAALREALIPPGAMPLEPPALQLDDRESASRFLLGNTLPAPPSGADGACRVLDLDGQLLGIAEISEGRIRPRVVVASPREMAGS